MHRVCNCVSYTAYLADGNSKGEARGRSKYWNNNSNRPGRRNVDTKRNNHKQSLACDKDLTIMLPTLFLIMQTITALQLTKETEKRYVKKRFWIFKRKVISIIKIIHLSCRHTTPLQYSKYQHNKYKPHKHLTSPNPQTPQYLSPNNSAPARHPPDVTLASVYSFRRESMCLEERVSLRGDKLNDAHCRRSTAGAARQAQHGGWNTVGETQ